MEAAKGLCIQTNIPLVLKECVAYSPINGKVTVNYTPDSIQSALIG
jgi:hypothetical protein